MLGGALNALCSDALTRWGVPGAVVGVLAGGEADFGARDGERFDSVPAGGPPRLARLGGRLAERR